MVFQEKEIREQCDTAEKERTEQYEAQRTANKKHQEELQGQKWQREYAQEQADGWQKNAIRHESEVKNVKN